MGCSNLPGALSTALSVHREQMESQLEKEARFRQLMAHSSHDSAIDTDSMEWETEVVELERETVSCLLQLLSPHPLSGDSGWTSGRRGSPLVPTGLQLPVWRCGSSSHVYPDLMFPAAVPTGLQQTCPGLEGRGGSPVPGKALRGRGAGRWQLAAGHRFPSWGAGGPIEAG